MAARLLKLTVCANMWPSAGVCLCHPSHPKRVDRHSEAVTDDPATDAPRPCPAKVCRVNRSEEGLRYPPLVTDRPAANGVPPRSASRSYLNWACRGRSVGFDRFHSGRLARTLKLSRLAGPAGLAVAAGLVEHHLVELDQPAQRA